MQHAGCSGDRGDQGTPLSGSDTETWMRRRHESSREKMKPEAEVESGKGSRGQCLAGSDPPGFPSECHHQEPEHFVQRRGVI